MGRRERLHVPFDADILPLLRRASEAQGFPTVQNWLESVGILHARRICSLLDSGDAEFDEFGRLIAKAS